MKLSDVQDMQIAKIRLGTAALRAPHPETVASLTASIKEVGVKQPLILNEKNQIVDGLQRYMAAVAAGLTIVPVRILRSNNDQVN